VAKLKTAIEVLLHAESARGSEARIMAAMETFYGLKADDPITPNTQTTAKQFAHGFVRDRSRVLHGTWSTLNARLSSSRDSLENLAVTLTRAYALELDKYIQSHSKDDIETFLDWVTSRRRQRRAAHAAAESQLGRIQPLTPPGCRLRLSRLRLGGRDHRPDCQGLPLWAGTVAVETPEIGRFFSAAWICDSIIG
jgi:hypothetical protein